MSIITLDPRQTKALTGYKNPNSPTFGDLKNSMINAGFDEEYAGSVHSRKPEWLTQGIVDDVRLIKRAESNLARYLEVNVDLQNDNGIDLARLQVDVSKFVLKTLAKGKYAEKGEEEAPAVQINIVNYAEKAKDVVQDVEVQDAEVK